MNLTQPYSFWKPLSNRIFQDFHALDKIYISCIIQYAGV